jgi:hypothetical protein
MVELRLSANLEKGLPMRYLFAVVAICFSALISAHAQNASDQMRANSPPEPEKGSNPSAVPQGPGENRKDSGTADQSGPSNASPVPDSNSQGDRSSHSVPGRMGREEPASHAPSRSATVGLSGQLAGQVLVDGRWNVIGAPQDSQTVPSKYSERNAQMDKIPLVPPKAN